MHGVNTYYQNPHIEVGRYTVIGAIMEMFVLIVSIVEHNPLKRDKYELG